jgi:threonine dehydratase
MASARLPVSRASIIEAAKRIAPYVRRTPVLELTAGDLGFLNPLSLKLDLFQHSGSFKARGAFNTILKGQISKQGVAAASGGNHGASVAHAAQVLGHRARIFVPDISSPAKVARIKASGAEVVQQGQRYDDARVLCEAYLRDSGAFGVPAFDGWDTIEGQGTVALEWLEQSRGIDTVLIAAGGGGLVSGVTLAIGRKVKVVAVEPTGASALHAAIKARKPVDVPVESIAADSLGAKNVGAKVLASCETGLAQSILVSDDAIKLAMKLLWDKLRIASEPGGAAALAALVSGAYHPQPNEKVGVLVCGGNVDLTVFKESVA